MSEPFSNRSIHIEQSAIGSTIISGDGNTIQNSIYVFHQELISEKSKDKFGSNPYKGLTAFKEYDTEFYFGREVQIDRLWKRFNALFEQSGTSRLLPILGPSGCGKSSLVRAGLIPELARRSLPGKEQIRIVTLVPGNRPVGSLAGVLARAITNDPAPLQKTTEFIEALRKPSEDGTYEGLKQIVSLIPDIKDSPLVILVDQFEEVYSLCSDPDERRIFSDLLFQVANDSTGKVAVVITLRTDFVKETQQHESLNGVIGSEQSVILPAMRPEELRRAIVQPAKLAGRPLDEALVALLVKDTQKRDGALPLLQFALTRIWEGMNDGLEPTDIYWEMGGVGGALAGKAQEIYDQLIDEDKESSRRIFINLRQFNSSQFSDQVQNVRRRLPIEKLVTRKTPLESIKRVIKAFSSPGARLLTVSGHEDTEILEITHEALFENWEQLKKWLGENLDNNRFQIRLSDAADYWDKHGRHAGNLWRSPNLELLKAFKRDAVNEMNELELNFFEASLRSDKNRKRFKNAAIIGLAILSVVASISSNVATRAARQANIQAQIAGINKGNANE